ncbi:MAG TPA: hypothetical protein VKZ50_18985 [bacterium]|nr:hypothetical protein [bacterium]
MSLFQATIGFRERPRNFWERISELTKQDHTLHVTSLAHLLMVERLGEAYQRMFSTQVFIEITKDEADKFDK